MNSSRSENQSLNVAQAVREACIEAALEGYERARISGLCHEGAWEAAVSAMRMLSLERVLEDKRG